MLYRYIPGMDLENMLKNRLAEYRDARKISWLAQQTGISQASLARAAQGQQELGLSAISRLLDFFGLRICGQEVSPAEFALIPKVTARAGAGSSLETDGAVEGYYAFRINFLQRAGVHPEDSIMLDVLGESMQPLIMSGDTILVDRRQNEPRDGRIYLVGLGEELLVKRLQKAPRGWLLVSQNPDFSLTAVQGADLELFRVYGRVCWFGRVL